MTFKVTQDHMILCLCSIATISLFCTLSEILFIVRQMQEKFGVKGKKLYFGFVDLEKAFDRVLEK